MTADVVPRMEAASPALNLPSAAKLRPSPAITGSMEGAIKMWLQVGNVQKLQQAVLDGYGWLLKDQSSRLPHVNKFLKKVPDYQEKIDTIHENVIRGDIRSVSTLLDKKGWANARDHYGHSPLHKSVMANQEDIMKFIVERYPDHASDRDNEGRTPLHYAAALQGTTGGLNQLYSILAETGADENVVDVQGHTPAYYRDHPQDIRHRTVQSRKPPPLQTNLMRADPDSATSPSKYSDDESAEQEKSSKAAKKSSKKKSKAKRPKTNERPDQGPPGGATSPGGLMINKNKQESAEKVFQSKLTVNRDLLNTDIKKFLHKSKTNFNVDEVKYAMDQARIIRASESEDHDTRERVQTKWKALAYKAKTQKGVFKPDDVDDEEYSKIERMIKGPSGKDATSHSLAQASVLGGSSSSPKRSKKFSKIMAAKEDPNDKWKTTIKKLVSNAEQEQDEESAKRLALIKDSRRAKASMSISGDHAKSDTFGQQKSKKTNKWQDALPLVPKKSKKEIVGGKDYEDADLAFYKAFKYIFVDIPEAEEDFPIPPPNRAYLRTLIHSGDLEHLEKVVLDGHGHKLVHETATLEKVTKFIYALPDFMDTISILHNATTAGVVPVVGELLTSERLALSRDQYGATPLHKAVLFYQPKLVKLIADKYRITTRAKDQEGRTPLHYSAALHDSGIFYRYLLKCGADENIQDKYGKTAKFYVYSPGEIDLNVLIQRCKEMPRKREPEGRQKMYNTLPSDILKQEAYLHANPPKVLSTIEVKNMIRQSDIEGLEQVILDGHGQKLLGENAADNKIRAFIKAVPSYLRKIEKIHETVVKGDLDTLQNLITRRKLALSKDDNGLGLLHKAVYHGHREIAEWLLEKYPECLDVKDWEGRLALHYAPVNANAMRLYSVLINHGADPSAEDSRGHNPQYYIDHVDEILIPEWSNKWSNMIAAQSPEPRRKKSERSTAAKERNALAKTIANAAKSARQKKREGLATATPRESVKPAIVDGKEDANTKNSVATAKSRSKTSTIRPKRAASTRRKLPPVKKSDTPNDTTNTNERK